MIKIVMQHGEELTNQRLLGLILHDIPINTGHQCGWVWYFVLFFFCLPVYMPVSGLRPMSWCGVVEVWEVKETGGREEGGVIGALGQ